MSVLPAAGSLWSILCRMSTARWSDASRPRRGVPAVWRQCSVRRWLRWLLPTHVVPFVLQAASQMISPATIVVVDDDPDTSRGCVPTSAGSVSPRYAVLLDRGALPVARSMRRAS